MKSSAAILSVLPLGALAGPVPDLFPRQEQELCGQWDLVDTDTYTLYNNLWGMDAADSGEQCTTLISADGNEISWSAAWTWIGDQYSVKSYPNVVLNAEPRSLGSISSMPTHWDWSYTGEDLIANVAYDIFTDTTGDRDNPPDYEFMIWLGALGGAGPISETGSVIGTPTIGGITWNLYEGSHSQMHVYSFVSPDNIESYSGDLADFTKYLMENYDVSSEQLVQSVGAGTEPFIGQDGLFTTSSYSVSIE